MPSLRLPDGRRLQLPEGTTAEQAQKFYEEASTKGRDKDRSTIGPAPKGAGLDVSMPDSLSRVLSAIGFDEAGGTTPTLQEKPLGDEDASNMIRGLLTTASAGAAPFGMGAMAGLSPSLGAAGAVVPQTAGMGAGSLLTSLGVGTAGTLGGGAAGRFVGKMVGAPESGEAAGEFAGGSLGLPAGKSLLSKMVNSTGAPAGMKTLATGAARGATPALMGTALKTTPTDFAKGNPIDPIVRHGITGTPSQMLEQTKAKLGEFAAQKAAVIADPKYAETVISGKNAIVTLKELGRQAANSAEKSAARGVRKLTEIVESGFIREGKTKKTGSLEQQFGSIGRGKGADLGSLMDTAKVELGKKNFIPEFRSLQDAQKVVDKIDDFITTAKKGSAARGYAFRVRAVINERIRTMVPELGELNEEMSGLVRAKRPLQRAALQEQVKRVPGAASGGSVGAAAGLAAGGPIGAVAGAAGGGLLGKILRMTLGNPAVASKVAQYGGQTKP